MGKKRTRHQNPEPFLPEDNVSTVSSKGRSKASKKFQEEEKFISPRMSSKILKEALIQQKEIQEALEEHHNQYSAVRFVEVQPCVEDEEDVDDFAESLETQSYFRNYDVCGRKLEEVDEEDEKLLEVFFSKDVGVQRTPADIIVEKIKEKDANITLEVQPLPKLDKPIIDLYKGVGEYLSKYTAGKIPKAFKSIPATQLWEEVLDLTEPEKWSPNAMFQATRIFSSNLCSKKAERFYRFVLLPRVREDIRKNKKLHCALYQSLKKSLYKPAAFFKGIFFPLCESGTCSHREAKVIGSIIKVASIPMPHSSVALLRLGEMEYSGTTSYFIELLLDKKYCLPYRVLDALVAHFMRILEDSDSRIMPVAWHRSLLTFVQRYKNELRNEDKDSIRTLLEKQKHPSITPEISWELKDSLNRGEKPDDLMLMSTPVSIVSKTIEEDRFDIP